MNVLQINTIDKRGGAAIIATRLRQSLIAKGHQSPMIVAHKTGNDSDIYQLPLGGRREKLNQMLHLAGSGYATYQELSDNKFFQKADVINLHNIHQMPHGFFNISDLPKITEAKPVIWTLHDPWVVYEFGKTPEYDVHFRKESPLFLRQKQSAIKKSRLIFTAPSQWLVNLVQEFYPSKDIRLLRYGIDINIFKPGDKSAARKKLGLNPKAKIILFVANEGEENGPKGVTYLNQAKESLASQGVEFISLGSSQKKTYINDPVEMADYYVASDIFALPSLAENSPITILEAMASGTPVVAFDIGGISGSVDHLKTGYLSKYKDSKDFIKGLETILANDSLQKSLGKNSRDKALKYFSLDTMVRNYLKLYREIL